MSEPQMLISAGEASSDMYAARLATALRARTGAKFFGMGGPRMARSGRRAGRGLSRSSGGGHHRSAAQNSHGDRRAEPAGARSRKARRSLAILVDSPGTHLGVARRLKKAKIPVGYFIGPQVWAWRAGRVRVVKRLVQRMVVIFPFEEKIYRDAGVPVDFVGHPLVDMVRATMSRAEFAAQHGLDASRPIVTMLPGSRPNEIAQNYARVIAACERIAQARRRAIRARRRARTERMNFSRAMRSRVRDQASRRRDIQRAGGGRLRHRRQRHGHGGSGAAGHADGGGLSRGAAYRIDSAAHDPNAIHRHGESDWRAGGWRRN